MLPLIFLSHGFLVLNSGLEKKQKSWLLLFSHWPSLRGLDYLCSFEPYIHLSCVLTLINCYDCTRLLSAFVSRPQSSDIQCLKIKLHYIKCPSKVNHDINNLLKTIGFKHNVCNKAEHTLTIYVFVNFWFCLSWIISFFQGTTLFLTQWQPAWPTS